MKDLHRARLTAVTATDSLYLLQGCVFRLILVPEGKPQAMTAAKKCCQRSRFQGLHCLQMCSFGGEGPADGGRDCANPLFC